MGPKKEKNRLERDSGQSETCPMGTLWGALREPVFFPGTDQEAPYSHSSGLGILVPTQQIERDFRPFKEKF